jgi:hypothetical protein
MEKTTRLASVALVGALPALVMGASCRDPLEPAASRAGGALISDPASDGVEPQAPTRLVSPWLVLLCRYSDVSSVPHDNRWYRDYFTADGSGLGGIYDYVRDNSNGTIDLGGSVVKPDTGWFVMPVSEGQDPPRQDRINLCLATAMAADPSIVPSRFAAIAVMTNNSAGGDGGQIGNGVALAPWAQDVSVGAHEVMHVYGLPHARSANGVEYGDYYDVMSCQRCASEPGGRFTAFGPSVNSALRISRGWLTPKGVVRGGQSFFTTLRALGDGADGEAVFVDLFNDGISHFVSVEYRRPSGWDANIPSGVIAIHEYRPWSPTDDPSAGTQPSSYLRALVRAGAGEGYDDSMWHLVVETVDHEAGTAAVSINIEPPPSCVATNHCSTISFACDPSPFPLVVEWRHAGGGGGDWHSGYWIGDYIPISYDGPLDYRVCAVTPQGGLCSDPVPFGPPEYDGECWPGFTRPKPTPCAVLCPACEAAGGLCIHSGTRCSCE